MITVSLITELLFISKVLKTPVSITLKTGVIKTGVVLTIKERVLDIWYLGYHIWNENLDDTVSMFGPESCQNISRIITMIDTDASPNQWRVFAYYEDREKKP